MAQGENVGIENLYLTDLEKRLLTDTPASAARDLLSRQVDSIYECSGDIVGVRTDDLLSLLGYYSSGYIPLSAESPIMDKEGDARYFLSANPDSAILEGKGINWSDEGLTLKKVVGMNQVQYGSMAIRMAIARNFGERLLGLKGEILANSLLDTGGCVRAFPELLFKCLAEEAVFLSQGSPGPSFVNYYVLDVLKRVMDPDEYHEFERFLISIQARGSILVAIGADIMNAGEFHPCGHAEDEISFSNAKGSIDTRHIIGFEALGAWEDAVLELLNQDCRLR